MLTTGIWATAARSVVGGEVGDQSMTDVSDEWRYGTFLYATSINYTYSRLGDMHL